MNRSTYSQIVVVAAIFFLLVVGNFLSFNGCDKYVSSIELTISRYINVTSM